MNGTGSLLRKSLEFLWRNPIVMLPVLVARVIDFAIYWICGLLKGPAVKALAPRSVLGGFSGKVDAPVVLAAGFFTFLPLIVEVGLLVYSMLVSARWANELRQSEHTDRSWKAPGADVARVALLTLCIGAVTAAVGLYLTLHGGVPVRWSYVVTWCFLLMATWFALPSWLGVLAQVELVRVRDTSKVPPFIAMALAFVGFAVLVYLGLALSSTLALKQSFHGEVAPFAINLAAGMLSAVPLTFGFVALSRYVADRPGWNPE